MRKTSIGGRRQQDRFWFFCDYLTNEMTTLSSRAEFESRLESLLIPEYVDAMLISKVSNEQIIRLSYSSASRNTIRLCGCADDREDTKLKQCERLAVMEGTVQNVTLLDEIQRLTIADSDGLEQGILEIHVHSVIILPVKSKNKVNYLLTLFPGQDDLRNVAKDFWKMASYSISSGLENVLQNTQIAYLEKALGRPRHRLQEYLDLLSHQLRTPLTVAMANIALARRTETIEGSPNIVQAQLLAAEESLCMMNKTLKTLGEVNELVGELDGETIDLTRFLQLLCQEHQCSLQFQDSRRVIVEGNEGLLNKAIGYCLDCIQGQPSNALQKVTIVLSIEEDFVKILIGAGTEAANTDLLTKLGQAHQGRPGNIGHHNGNLETYLASEIINYHMGKFYDFSNETANGFVIMLPIAPGLNP